MIPAKPPARRVLLALVFIGATAAAVAAANGGPMPGPITVTRFDDPLPPRVCSPADCSLRAAIVLANNVPGRQTVILPAGVYDLALGRSASDFYEDEGYLGDLDVRGDIVLQGSGASGTIITDSTSFGPERAFEVLPGASLRASDLTVSGLIFSFRPPDCGLAFWNRGGTLDLERVNIISNAMRGSGGAICNEEGGVLTLRDSAITGNGAYFAGQGGGIYNRDSTAVLERVLLAENQAQVEDGGGIYSEGNSALTIRDSLILGNETHAPFGTRRGGGIAAGGQVTLANVTITGNHSEGTYADIGEKDSRGGGLYLWGQASLTNVTITGNDSETTAGGLFAAPGAHVTLVNTIIAGNSGGDCEGPITSAGHNIDGDGSCGLSGPGDLPNTDPMLAPLAGNGGPTETHALLPGSPAIDAGDAASCPDTDQRGAPRPVDGDGSGAADCDIGAFEAGSIVPTPPPPTPPPSPPPPVPHGDADCDNDVDAVDALAILRATAGLNTAAQCLLAANTDCDLDVDSVDALRILRAAAALPLAQPPGCPDIGQPH